MEVYGNGSSDLSISDPDLERQLVALNENKEMEEELHLAAILGKTLLERNTELEEQVKKLEEHIDETLLSNRNLTTQLSNTKEALRQANSSCESLEQKLEETERENRELKTTNLRRQVTIDLKTKIINDLHDRLEGFERELSEMKTLKSRDVPDGASNKPSSNNDSCRDLTRLNHDELLKEHYEIVEDLSIKLQNTNYQKNKTQTLLDTVKTENAKLSELLERTELENIELRSHVSALEEKLLNLSTSEPVTPSLPPTSPPKTFFARYPSEESPSFSRVTTLHTELLVDYQTMKEQYDYMVSNCRCESKSHMNLEDGDTTKDDVQRSGVDGKDKKNKTEGGSVVKESSLKDLFQEVYATLKATTVVADRLIEKRNHK
ncbi:PREDICTED: cerebellar degeneration-related protein 2-like [Amphimedon queenslandica]|uniref:Uncharacterized protein n=1 Tax=Amphimedon queenslandica TaxID=400682 RepID=A0A1X7VTU5_AMPQE|nr:PREDICTED: cerebellar degeneration-related protein 2-like [Amphimedon queenslandica]|eukprot:XP_003382903.1 PREDICTED: cerebellar degeneration-related protein 2-like [Amphimedon queenslandica]